ncbi:MAG: flagellar filament capping protein FliD [Methylocystaceae bacterium]
MASSISTVNRLTGLASGMDTETWVSDLMKAARVPQDKLKQQRQINQWKMDDLRAINTSLLSLRGEVLNLKLSGTYQARKVISENEDVVTATAQSGASLQPYQVKVNNLASLGSNNSTQSLTEGVVLGEEISAPVDLTGTNFSLKYDGTTYNINFDTSYADLNSLQTALQSKIDTALGGDPGSKVKVTVADNMLKFVSQVQTDGSIPKMEFIHSTTNDALGKLGLSQARVIVGQQAATLNTAEHNKFKLNYNGTTYNISLTEKTYTSVGDLATEIQNQIAVALGNTMMVSVTSTGGIIKLEATATSAVPNPTLQIEAGDSKDALSVLGLSAGQMSYTPVTFDPTGTLYDQRNILRDSDFGWDSDHKFYVEVNGEGYSIDADTSSLQDVMDTINGSIDTGVNMIYEPSTSRVSITARKTGNVPISVSGNFMTKVLHIDNSKVNAGADASFSINGLEITSQSNSYILNGVTFNFKGTGSTIVNVNADIENAITKIKSFVESYNKVIETLNTKTSESRVKDTQKKFMQPLTDEEKQELKDAGKESDIVTWQANARKGLLRMDSNLRNTLTQMQSALGGLVSGITGTVTVTQNSKSYTTVPENLTKIGITTMSYKSGSLDNGKLELDETKLREALESNPDAVKSLLASNDGDDDVSSSTDGLAVRLYDVLSKSISSITSEVGIDESANSQSEIGRSIDDLDERISDLEDRLTSLEERYWKQFTALETYLAKANQQSSWLTSQFSTNQSSS